METSSFSFHTKTVAALSPSSNMRCRSIDRIPKVPFEGLYLPSVLDGKEVELLLHAEVVEGKIDAALGVGDDQPHAVHVVAVLLGIVRGQQHPGRSGEVEETGNCSSDRKTKKDERRKIRGGKDDFAGSSYRSK